MATFNGAKYVAEQLDSILAQTHQDWALIIRDDLSTDQTPSIIQRYAEADSRIKVLSGKGKHGSATLNFSVLFDYAHSLDTPYLMFADQDDVWKPNKIKNSLQFIQERERTAKPSDPILVYGALEYVDEAANIIPQKIRMPESLDFKMLLAENHAYGCTMIFNRALLQQIGHIPDSAENHDYWVALVATAMGKAVLNPEKLIFYRQHSSNASGGVARNRISSRIHRYIKQVDFLLPVFVKNYKMINTFYWGYKERLDENIKQLLAGYIKAYKTDMLSLMIFMVRHNFRKLGMMQTLAHYYTLVQLRRKVLTRAEQ
ncbi:glycosyl transferase [Pedobacter quisquiliarum]|uniref:Glycosyl transferase n=2 Tax=Pedobacter quisquiliarum TaxID=1834438 RepID=A0A916U925_9SPHI|nr:glycosyl transferase [Pedobacter quisquiliarum]